MSESPLTSDARTERKALGRGDVVVLDPVPLAEVVAHRARATRSSRSVRARSSAPKSAMNRPQVPWPLGSTQTTGSPPGSVSVRPS
ncbi:MAG TPA: hypothetical protein VIL73_07280 [Gaiellaceae bacterium]